MAGVSVLILVHRRVHFQFQTPFWWASGVYDPKEPKPANEFSDRAHGLNGPPPLWPSEALATRADALGVVAEVGTPR